LDQKSIVNQRSQPFRVVRWLKSVGNVLTPDEPFVTIHDPRSGTLNLTSDDHAVLEWCAREGTFIQPGDALAKMRVVPTRQVTNTTGKLAKVSRLLKIVGQSVSYGDDIAEVRLGFLGRETTTVKAPGDGVIVELTSEGKVLLEGEQVALLVQPAPEPPVRGIWGSARPVTSSAPGPSPAPLQSSEPTLAPRKDRVFLCYRRDDTEGTTDRIHDQLVNSYGRDRVFMDVESTPLGVNFARHIERQLEECGAMLVVIGRQWTLATDKDGNRRLDDPADHVRQEIASALKLGIPVIPLLVQDATMPKPKDLPEDIRDLAFQNGMPLPRAFWKESVERLVRELNGLIGPTGAK
jgi:hypothetical protein